LRNAQSHRGLTEQLALNLGQCQVRFGLNPSPYLLLRLGSGMQLASGAMRHPLGLPAAVSLRGNLLPPTQADEEPFRQLFQRSLALVIGRKKLAAQIIPIGLPHIFFAANCRQVQSTLFPKML